MKSASLLVTAALSLLATSAIAEDVRSAPAGDNVQMTSAASTQNYAAPQHRPAHGDEHEIEMDVHVGK